MTQNQDTSKADKPEAEQPENKSVVQTKETGNWTQHIIALDHEDGSKTQVMYTFRKWS